VVARRGVFFLKNLFYVFKFFEHRELTIVGMNIKVVTMDEIKTKNRKKNQIPVRFFGQTWQYAW
jgi:hypothetical protein